MTETTKKIQMWARRAVNRSLFGGHIKPDTILALKGPQGCGKSNLLANLFGPLKVVHFQHLSAEKTVLYRQNTIVELSPSDVNDKIIGWMTAEKDCFRAPYQREFQTPARNFTPAITGLPFEVDKMAENSRRFWVVDFQDIELDLLNYSLSGVTTPATPSAGGE